MDESPTKLEEIFYQASQIESGKERERFLKRVCGGNQPLREQVDKLLASSSEMEDFLLVPALDRPSTDPGETQPVFAEGEGDGDEGDDCGITIDRYKLLEKIGEGGFGVVYMAEQTKPVRRRVAVKLIKPGMDSKLIIARFEAERQALAIMDHQNIARVLDAGTSENGRPYFVMELVKGVPITDYCDANRLSPGERLKIMIDVCMAIQHAHQKGVIHRDIKPSNVMVTLHDGEPVPKVIDFGVAKAIQQPLTEKTMFTRFGQVMGTLRYMSPEQAEFSGLDIDTRSDIYSLGVLLYELLTGSTPIVQARFKEAAFDEALRMIREEEPMPPSIRISKSGTALASISSRRSMEPLKLGKLVRGELDWITLQTLEKDRTRRYDSAAELARDLRRYLDNEPVSACPATATYRISKFVRKHRMGACVAAAFATILIGAAAGGSILANRAISAREEANQFAAQAQRSAALANEQKEIAEDNSQRAEEATFLMKTHLVDSQLENAKAVLSTSKTGRRWDALKILAEAAASSKDLAVQRDAVDTTSFSCNVPLPSVLSLRSQAVRGLLVSDGRVDNEWPAIIGAISPSGDFAVSMNVNEKGMSLKTIDLRTGNMTLDADTIKTVALFGNQYAISNGGKLLAMSKARGGIRIFELPSTKKQRDCSFAEIYSGENDIELTPRVKNLQFSPDGEWLVGLQPVKSPSAFRILVVWNVADKNTKPLAIALVQAPFFNVAIDEDSKLIAAATGRKTVSIWELETGNLSCEYETELGLGAICFRNGTDEIFIQTVSDQQDGPCLIEAWNYVKRSVVQTMRVPQNTFAMTMHCSSAGNRILLSTASGRLIGQKWNTEFDPLFNVDASGTKQDAKWLGKHSATTLGIGKLSRWKFTGEKFSKSISIDPLTTDSFLRSMVVSDSETFCAIESSNNSILIVDLSSGEVRRVIECQYVPGSKLHFSANSTKLLRTGARKIEVWSVEGEASAEVIENSLKFVQSVGHPPFSPVLIAGINRTTLTPAVVDIETKKVVWEHDVQSLRTPTISLDGRLVAFETTKVSNKATTVNVIELRSGKTIGMFDAGSNANFFSIPLHISPDNRWLLKINNGNPFGTSGVGIADPGSGNVGLVSHDQPWHGIVWGIDSKSIQLELSGDSTVREVVFSQDGRYLAVSMHDGLIGIWDVEQSECVFHWQAWYPFDELPQSARSIAFSNSGNSLVLLRNESGSLQIIDLIELKLSLKQMDLDW